MCGRLGSGRPGFPEQDWWWQLTLTMDAGGQRTLVLGTRCLLEPGACCQWDPWIVLFQCWNYWCTLLCLGFTRELRIWTLGLTFAFADWVISPVQKHYSKLYTVYFSFHHCYKIPSKNQRGEITEILGFKICSGEEITMLLILYKLGNLFLVCSPCSGPGTAPLCGLGPGCRVNPACILKGKLLSPASGV